MRIAQACAWSVNKDVGGGLVTAGDCWGEGSVIFWTGRQGETPGTCPGPSSSSRESLGKVTHPLISTAAPKHAGYLGSLRIHLWLKKRMQSQGKGKQAAS